MSELIRPPFPVPAQEKCHDIIVPAVLSETRQATCTGKWYVDEAEFPPALAIYDALINGEETFRAVHLAIAAATETVDIVCWGLSSLDVLHSRWPTSRHRRTAAHQGQPGLKVHIGSRVAPDSPAGTKLMIINDVFTTHGSANINTRSRQVDSELNSAHEWVSVTEGLRRRLWAQHLNKEFSSVPDDPRVAFDVWAEIISKNKIL
ncbi:hypothetical protein [Pseudomonas sp. dw_358]|uniref:hypothetical protein n=1 Tax=Pseudomonas sp. dw_358 TaxID=2720083 RepID=UPI001BD5C8B3|nr:hypothetical protein [Pseudomonas sp. dw_358]